MPATGIFVSYRREDTAGHAGRLAEQLARRFGNDQVFIDINAIPAGVDFEQRIHETLARSRVTLVLIGEKWLEARAADGTRRIDEPGDYVRKEIAEALARPDTTVIPVLIERADMPPAALLPPEIAELAKRNACKVGNERWGFDVQRLTERIDELSSTSALARGRRRLRRRPGLVGGVAALVVAAVVALVIGAGTGGSTAAGIRVDDVPLSNPRAQFASLGQSKPDTQVESTKPYIELKIHNLGTQASDLTRARVTVADVMHIKPCFSAGGGPLSAVYHFILPLTKGASRDDVINEQVKPDAIDYFRIVFSIPQSAYGPGGLDQWLFRLHIQVLHDAQPTPVDAGYVLLAFSGAPDPGNFGSYWTKTSSAKPGYGAAARSFGAANIKCSIRQSAPIEQFLKLPGRRSQELTDFASQLTTTP